MCKRSYTKGTADSQKVQKLVPVLDGNLTVKKLKNFQQGKLCKIKQIQNISVTFRTFLSQANFFFLKIEPKEDSSKITTSEVLSKIPNCKKTLKQQYNLCKAKIILEA